MHVSSDEGNQEGYGWKPKESIPTFSLGQFIDMKLRYFFGRLHPSRVIIFWFCGMIRLLFVNSFKILQKTHISPTKQGTWESMMIFQLSRFVGICFLVFWEGISQTNSARVPIKCPLINKNLGEGQLKFYFWPKMFISKFWGKKKITQILTSANMSWPRYNPEATPNCPRL